ncbi:gonadotropin-releasing hormone receptor-like [Pollicipes pollicipes]|uniref:gonadotropin-releasing hormone receptor-like n=1 Tax=Pollicipes pollicipes TaxID=41117 RepID=UPI001884F9C5|nr:gonadotropin-releasing hormone receptor-like [Pollicipes pollicipes]
MDVSDPTAPPGSEVTTEVSGERDPAANSTEWPAALLFQEKHVVGIVANSLMFVISAPANISVILTLLRKRRRMKRLNLMLLHLAIADLIVTCILMPLEVGWSATVQWLGGELLCRLLAFLKVFGLYLSNFVLVCISIDRYCAVVRPMALLGTANRCKRTLSAAWLLSAVCSFPQILVFHVERHPDPRYKHLNFIQCVSFFAFPHPALETTYNISSFLFMYPIPLLVIVFCYTRIVMELTRRTTATNSDTLFRANDSGFFVRARQRTMQMTFVIVLTFIVCWTPYYIMTIWYWVDRKSAETVNPMVGRVLFIFASGNSCANPLVYGFYHSQLCLLPEVPCSKRQKSPSVELAILDTARTCDTLLRQSSGLKPASLNCRGRNGNIKALDQGNQRTNVVEVNQL